MAFNNSTVAVQTQQNPFAYAIFLLRIIASFATFTNLCILILLIRLKKSFHNYSYWFQILVLAGEDLFNGLTSFGLCFYDLKIFKNYLACSFIICAYTCAQINTLLAICCICVSRFRSIQNINKLGEPGSRYHQEISIVIVAVFSIIYASLPYFTLNITTSSLPMCAAPILFGSQVRTYKLLIALGLAIPLITINILYGICLVKLKHVNTTVEPASQRVKSALISCSQITEDTYDSRSSTKGIPFHLTSGKSSFHNMSVGNLENTPKGNEKPLNTTSATKPISVEDSVQDTGLERNFPISTEDCSTSATNSALNSGRSKLPKYSKARKNTRELQYRAIKLLGIILFTSNIATVVPVAVLLRDVTLTENIPGDGSAVGMVLVSLNSLVDAFVYGLYAVEIRTYIHKKLIMVRQLFPCKII